MRLGDEIYGLVAIAEPRLNEILLNAERRGRLVDVLGLSIRGRATTQVREDGEPALRYTKVIAAELSVPLRPVKSTA